jgi:hypothetical protein
MGDHLIGGEFQSDKYPSTPRGKVPLSCKDPTAQDLLWEYAERRRKVDAEFSADLEEALRIAGYKPCPRLTPQDILARPRMPIQLPRADALKGLVVPIYTALPMALFAPHEDQAQRNHGQTLKELAGRGGLSACEAVAILEDRDWRSMMHAVAYRRLAAIALQAGC